ncbi:unnamed protein product [Gadus morhua 'NCC']
MSKNVPRVVSERDPVPLRGSLGCWEARGWGPGGWGPGGATPLLVWFAYVRLCTYYTRDSLWAGSGYTNLLLGWSFTGAGKRGGKHDDRMPVVACKQVITGSLSFPYGDQRPRTSSISTTSSTPSTPLDLLTHLQTSSITSSTPSTPLDLLNHLQTSSTPSTPLDLLNHLQTSSITSSTPSTSSTTPSTSSTSSTTSSHLHLNPHPR